MNAAERGSGSQPWPGDEGEIYLPGPLQKSLRDAFLKSLAGERGHQELHEFVSLELGWEQDAIRGDSVDLMARVLDLIEYAIKKGRVQELFDKAIQWRDPRGSFKRLLVEASSGSGSTAEDRERQRLELVGQELTTVQFQLVELGSMDSEAGRRLELRIKELRKDIRRGPQLNPNEWLGSGRGRYRLQMVIGEGGYATVWKALDRETGDTVAIKVMSPTSASDRDRLDRFKRGAHTMMSLNNSNIARVRGGVEQHEGFYYVVMDFYKEGDLRAARRRSDGKTFQNAPLSLKEGLRLVVEAARGLEYAHQKGYIHRDVKPANILIDDEIQARVTDFDLVLNTRRMDAATTHLLTGTALYAASELRDDVQPASETTDVYALGLTALYALTGVEPSDRDAWRMQPDLDYLSCPETLKNVLLAAIAFDRGARTKSIREFRQALEREIATLGDIDPVLPADPWSVLDVVKSAAPTPTESELEGILTRLGVGGEHLPPLSSAPWSYVAFNLVIYASNLGVDPLAIRAELERIRPKICERYVQDQIRRPGARPRKLVEAPGRIALLRGLLSLDEYLLQELVRRLGYQAVVRSGPSSLAILDVLLTADLENRGKELGDMILRLQKGTLPPNELPSESAWTSGAVADIVREMAIEIFTALPIPPDEKTAFRAEVRMEGTVPRRAVIRAKSWFAGAQRDVLARSFLEACDELDVATRRLDWFGLREDRAAIPGAQLVDLIGRLSAAEELFDSWRRQCEIPWWALPFEGPVDDEVIAAINFGVRYLPDPTQMWTVMEKVEASFVPGPPPVLITRARAAMAGASVSTEPLSGPERDSCLSQIMELSVDERKAVEYLATDGRTGCLPRWGTASSSRAVRLFWSCEAKGITVALRAMLDMFSMPSSSQKPATIPGEAS